MRVVDVGCVDEVSVKCPQEIDTLESDQVAAKQRSNGGYLFSMFRDGRPSKKCLFRLTKHLSHPLRNPSRLHFQLACFYCPFALVTMRGRIIARGARTELAKRFDFTQEQQCTNPID